MPDEAQIREAQELRLRFLNAVWDHEHKGEILPTADAVAAEVGMNSTNWVAIERVTAALRGDGLLDGAATAEHGLVRVRLTPQGRRLVESKAAGNEPPGGSPASIGNVQVGNHSVVQISQHSPGSTQQAEITPFDKRAMKQWASDVLDRAQHAGLPDEDLAEVKHEAQELRAELEKANPDPSNVRRMGKYVLRILSTAGASLASSGLVEVGKELFLN